MKILLIEDDLEISEMLKNYLITENYEVVCAKDGEEACRLFEPDSFSLILIDLMIPKISGMEVLQNIRKSSTVPIIIVSAKDTDSDKALGLGLGADDYITKPFSMTEILARIKANIRRTTVYTMPKTDEQRILKKGCLTINTVEHSVLKGDKRLDLTATEFQILKLLMEHPQRVYTKEQIYSVVWKDAYIGDENAINVHISRLRNKIEDDARNPQYILTVWGIGYKLGE